MAIIKSRNYSARKEKGNKGFFYSALIGQNPDQKVEVRGYQGAALHRRLHFCCATQAEADELRTKAPHGIMELGLTPNFKKTMGVAAKRCKFLGFIIDSETMRMYVPDTRMNKLNEALQVLLERDDDASARELASVCGKAMSTAPAVTAVRCLTRETYNIIRPEEGDWDAMIEVTQVVKDELKEIVV